MAGRGARFEYEIGEHVLCFEPDLTKARVLYDAKVVDQLMVKDSSGRKRPSYVVHFQGWNSSWDRQVGDQYVLRNTDENRDLMKKLAETAKRLKNSQRRRKINAILHQAFGGSPPEFDDASESDESAEESDNGKAKVSKGKAILDKKKQKPSNAEFEIPESLKLHLEEDYILINKRNKLTQVPAKPCVIEILESFMKTFCVNYVCDPTGGREKTRNSNKHTLKCSPDKCVSLCKEFVDSLRIVFDFTLPIILLYAAEQQQYESAIASVKPADCNSRDKESEPPSKISKHSYSRSKWRNDSPMKQSEQQHHHHQQQQQQFAGSSSPVHSASSSSSIGSSPATPPRRVTRQGIHDLPKASMSTKHKSSASHKHSKALPAHSISMSAKLQDEEKLEPIIPIASRTRRRSQLEVTELDNNVFMVKLEPGSEGEQFNESLAALEQNMIDPVSMNGQDSGQSGAGSESTTMSSCAGREDAMDRILGWQLLPMEVRLRNPITPSQIYGTIHLLRMFVKLPDLLKKMKMKEVQLQIIIKFTHHCLQYLVDHQSDLLNNQTYVKA